MIIESNIRKASGKFLKYNLWWEPHTDPLSMELHMISRGGQWAKKNGEMAGEGLKHHFRRFQEIAWPGRIWESGPFKNHWAEQCLDVYLNYTYIGVMGCAASGKCLAPHTPVLFFDGSVRPANQVRVGDKLMGDDSTPRTVLSLNTGRSNMVRIVPTMGDAWECNDDHILTLKRSWSGRKSYRRVGEVIDISVKGYLAMSASMRRKFKLFCARAEFQEQDVEFDPQIYGIWLGDGGTGRPMIHIHDQEKEVVKFTLNYFRSMDYKISEGRYGAKDCPSYMFTKPSRGCLGNSNPFYNFVRESSPNGEKRILPRYLFNSTENRLKLLAGIIDSDGYAAGTYFEICCSIDGLASDIVYLARSLGFRVTVRKRRVKCCNNGKWCSTNRINIMGDGLSEIPTLRKRCRPKKTRRRSECTSFEIEQIGVGDWSGFTLDGNGRFLLGDFTVTHNSDSFGCNALTDWYAHHSECTVLVTSTERDMLELRIWGMIKKYHKLAKSERDWIPGHLIEGKQRLITDPRSEFTEGRDFKNGIMGVACKKGNQYVGLGSMIGIHNKIVTLIADEANLMPRAFLDSTSNLSKCERFKLVALGNPNETTNAHGSVCEPHADLGGWEGGIDQSPGTKTWKTRWPNGICLQLPGSDSPNIKVEPDKPAPFPFLVTSKQMQDDAAIWGVDDWHYTMMNEARMPRGQGSRRVLTRQACLKFGAFNPPNWRDSRITKIAFLDAAYRGVGGDRCVFGELNYGFEIEENPLMTSSMMINALTSQAPPVRSGRQIMALIDLVVVPVVAAKDSDQPEDQIVQFVNKELANRGIPHSNFFYDAGMRTTLVSAFARSNMIETNTVDCGGRPSEDMVSAEIQKMCCDYYSKFVTELWFSVRYVVESRQFRGMIEEACSEFGQREFKMVSGNRIEVESKAEMKLKTGRSPDLADALAVGVYGARKRGFIIQKLANPARIIKPGQDWKDKLRDQAKRLARSGSLTHN